MGTYNIRLGSQLTFDEEQEADIIKTIEAMNASHKTGQFISNLIRLAFDCPDILEKKNGEYEKGNVIKLLESAGKTSNRQLFFNQLSKEVDDMKQKVDKMYNMVLKTYILAQMGKQIGLSEKTENHLMAQFILEKQLKELQDKLGITLSSSVFASNKKQEVEKIADEALEYIIESYSGIVNELRTIISNNTEQSRFTIVENSKPEINNIQTYSEVETQKENKVENSTDSENSITDDFVDFGNADLGALANFFSTS